MTSAMAIALGANAKAQAICFALCFAAGLVAGVPALLYLRRASAAERILTDLFATLVIAGGLILCAEFILDGKCELYAALAYAAGCASVPLTICALRRAKRRRSAIQKSEDNFKNDQK